MADMRKSHMAPLLAELQHRQSMRQSVRSTPTPGQDMDFRKQLPAEEAPVVRQALSDDKQAAAARRSEALRHWARVRSRLNDVRKEEENRATADVAVPAAEINRPRQPPELPIRPPKETAAPQAELSYPTTRLRAPPAVPPSTLKPIRPFSNPEAVRPKSSVSGTEVAVVGADRLGHRGVGYVIKKVKDKVGLHEMVVSRKRNGSFKNFAGQRPEIEIAPEEHERVSMTVDQHLRNQAQAAERARRQAVLLRPACYESQLRLPRSVNAWPLSSEPISAYGPQSVRLRVEVQRDDERGLPEPFLCIRLRPDNDDEESAVSTVSLPNVMHRRTISLLDQRPVATTAGIYHQKQQDLTNLVFVDEPPFGRGAALRWAAQHYFRAKAIPLRSLLAEDADTAGGGHYVRDGFVTVRLLLEPLFPVCQFWASNDGKLTCRVDRVKERRHLERAGLSDCYRSDYFYSSPHGYRLQLCIYLNGAGAARGTHMSAFLHFLAGEWDERLPSLRHFPHLTRLALLDPLSVAAEGGATGQRPPARPLRLVELHNTDGFVWDFVLDLATRAEMKSDAFVKDDILLVQVTVEPLTVNG